MATVAFPTTAAGIRAELDRIISPEVTPARKGQDLAALIRQATTPQSTSSRKTHLYEISEEVRLQRNGNPFRRISSGFHSLIEYLGRVFAITFAFQRQRPLERPMPVEARVKDQVLESSVRRAVSHHDPIGMEELDRISRAYSSEEDILTHILPGYYRVGAMTLSQVIYVITRLFSFVQYNKRIQCYERFINKGLGKQLSLEDKAALQREIARLRERQANPYASLVQQLHEEADRAMQQDQAQGAARQAALQARVGAPSLPRSVNARIRAVSRDAVHQISRLLGAVVSTETIAEEEDRVPLLDVVTV